MWACGLFTSAAYSRDFTVCYYEFIMHFINK